MGPQPSSSFSHSCYREKKEVLDITLADFDGCSYHVSTPNPDERNIILVSLAWRAAAECLGMGGKEDLAKIYGPMLTAPESGYDVTLKIDLDNPLEPKGTSRCSLRSFQSCGQRIGVGWRQWRISWRWGELERPNLRIAFFARCLGGDLRGGDLACTGADRSQTSLP